MTLSRRLAPIIIIIVAIISSRISYLVDPALMLDGDECVVGIMARHAYYGQGLSAFFIGQDYGFSLIEVLFILPFYAILGTGTIAVKLAMLSLWSIGVVFLYKTMVAIDRDKRTLALILTLILALSPAWVNWSMKARGGYLTSFTLTSIALYLLYYPKAINQWLRYGTMAVLIYLIYESQLFWLAGLLPLVLHRLVKERKVGPTAVALVLMIGCYFFFAWLKSGLYIMYNPPRNTVTWEVVLQKAQEFPRYVYKSLQGNYFFSFYQGTNSFYTSFAKAFTILIFILLLIGILHLLFHRKGFGLFLCSIVFIPLSFAYTLPVVFQEGRYLLPLTAFTLLAVFIYATKLRAVIPVYLLGTYLAIAAAVTLFIFPIKYQYKAQKKDLLEVIDYLLEPENGPVKYVYTFDYMMPWEIMYYSNEEIRARMAPFPGRYPQYDTTIDRALYSGKPAALVSYTGEFGGLKMDTYDLQNRYFVKLSPTREFLNPEFEFPLPDSSNRAPVQ